jgi:hypothetical protein
MLLLLLLRVDTKDAQSVAAPVPKTHTKHALCVQRKNNTAVLFVAQNLPRDLLPTRASTLYISTN